MQDNLLWVYEGQTQFWGLVLAARSGVQSKENVLGQFANYAGMFTYEPGRAWRSVEDTTHDPIIANRRPKPFASLDRNEDYYTEGALVWLEADQIIRQGTAGKKGLDDFAKAFFGMDDESFLPLTYTFDDVVKALNGVYPYDWATFLRTRLDRTGGGAPLDGITRGGYKLVYSDTPSDYIRSSEARRGTALTYSLGFSVGRDGTIGAVMWDSLAFKAGLTAGKKIIAVNGRVFDSDRLKDIVTAAAKPGNTDKIELLVQDGDYYRTLSFDYHGGLRYPKLVRIDGTPDRLHDIYQGK
jgi:predicted metalloprotease with PDZ domain